MSKNLQKVFFFYFWWNILWAFKDVPGISYINRFDFIFVLISGYYLFKEVFILNLNKYNSIPKSYQLVMILLLLWVVLNIFRNPPTNPKGFIRFFGGQFYVAAWFPLLFFYIGAKINNWNSIWHFAIKLIKFFALISPFLIVLYLSGDFMWTRIVILFFIFPILIVNWDILTLSDRRYLILGILISIFISFTGGSRGWTLFILYYIPVLYWSFLIRKQQNRVYRLIKMSLVLIAVLSISYYIYNDGISNKFSGQMQERISKFEGDGFNNSREMWVYPDFFADMKTTEDWIFGRGLNGSYYSEIFEKVMENLDESNSLGLKKGYRPNLECGYLQTILKIGLVGLLLELMLAISAIYLGLFKSKNWFVKGCAFIIIQWVIYMYPAGLPEWSISYMLFWLCIGACLSRETRQVTSSLVFINNTKFLNKNNTSFLNWNRF